MSRDHLRVISNPVAELARAEKARIAHVTASDECERQKGVIAADLKHLLDRAFGVADANNELAHPRWVVDMLTDAAERARRRFNIRL